MELKDKKFDVTISQVQADDTVTLEMKIVQQPDVPYADFTAAYHGMSANNAGPLVDAAKPLLGSRTGLNYEQLCHLEAEVMATLMMLGSEHPNAHAKRHGQ